MQNNPCNCDRTAYNNDDDNNRVDIQLLARARLPCDDRDDDDDEHRGSITYTRVRTQSCCMAYNIGMHLQDSSVY